MENLHDYSPQPSAFQHDDSVQEEGKGGRRLK